MGRTVMIVDDSVSMRQLVTFTLRGAGFEVLEAADGAEGVNKLNMNGKVDVIITDLNMPTMNGIEFLKQVRSNYVHKFTPVIMLTTESEQSKVLEAKAAGVSGWIIKPFTPEKLVETIKRFVK